MKLENKAKSGDEQITVIEVVLDASGSMQGNKSDTLGGLNSYIEDQKKQLDGGQVRFSLTQFPSVGSKLVDNLYNMVPIENINPIKDSEYKIMGMTPLLDAVGTRIAAVDSQLGDFKTAPSVLFVIITDGDENESKEYTTEMITKLITEHEEKGWVFVFLGANQDSWGTGISYGMQGGNTLNVADGTSGMSDAFASVSRSTTNYRTQGSGYTATFFEDEAKSVSKNSVGNSAGDLVKDPVNKVSTPDVKKKSTKLRKRN